MARNKTSRIFRKNSSRPRIRKDKPLLAVITTVLGTTGGDRWLYVLEDRWASLGIEVNHVHATGPARTEPPMPPATARVIAGSRLEKRARADIWHVITTTLREIRRADVVLLEPQGRSAPVAFVLSKLAGRPTVIYSQGLADLSFRTFEPNRVNRAIARFVFRHVDRVMCVSPASVQAAIRERVAPEKIVEVRTGLDIDAVRRRLADTVEPMPPDGEIPLIVGCGPVSRHKGFDRTVLAVAELKKRGRAVALTVAGPPGDDFDEVTRLVRAHDLEDRVTFVSGVDAVPLMARADVFVHAARYESVGLVLLESLCLGTPVIAYDAETGGPRLVLDGGRYGRLLPTEATAQTLADAIEEHLEMPADLRDRAKLAEDFLSTDFSVDKAAEVSATVFRDLASFR
jgi:glycosyltransferase involved in cell wall biosynthesis